MNTSGNCGACGTPKSKNRFGESDCPHCNSENFVDVSFSPVREEIIPTKKELVMSPIIEETETEETFCNIKNF